MACLDQYKYSELVHNFIDFSQNDGPNVFLGMWGSTLRAPGNVSVLIYTWNGVHVKVIGVSLVCQL